MLKNKILASLLATASGMASAQLDSLKMNLDLRTRGELDHGARTLILKGKSPETTVVSRTRFGIDYYYKSLEVYISAQDVRTWGETASTAAKNQDFTVNEAWRKWTWIAFKINPNFRLK